MKKLSIILSLCCLILGTKLFAYEPPHNWVFRTHSNGQIYYLYIPDGMEEGKTYPVVLGLHGSGWDGVAPSLPPPNPFYSAFHGFNTNTQIEPTFIVAPYSVGSWIDKSDKVMQILTDLQAEFPIDSERIILTGFSMGGIGGIQYLNKYPNTFAGAILVAIALSSPDLFDSVNFVNVPIWGGVGEIDSWKANMDPVMGKIRAANGYPNDPAPELYGLLPRYSTYPGVGHNDCPEALFGNPEVIEWAYALRKDGNAMPMVQFVDPTPAPDVLQAEGTTTITLAAEAKDPDGEIQSLEFFDNGESVGLFHSPPYQVTLESLAPGDHWIQVKVVDNGKSQGHAVDKVNEDRRLISISAPLTITSESPLPEVRAGEYYDLQLTADGINGQDTWLQSGNKLPPGLLLSTAGRIQGISTQVGEYTMNARVTDAKKVSVAKSLTVKVIPARPRQPMLTDIVVNGRTTLQPWNFAPGEPWGTSGFGNPPGNYKRAASPLFDGIDDTDGINGAYFMRVVDNGASVNSTGADWIQFNSDLPVRIHIAYMDTPESKVPAWLASDGFVATGKTVKTYRINFVDYAKDFPAGTISLSGNEGATTGATTHYLIIVEALADGPAEYPWSVENWMGGSGDLLSTWMGEGYVTRSAYPWVYHSDHGWLCLFGESSDSVWWYTQPDQFWWTAESVYPWIYRWSSGWWYYMEGTRNPAWYYDTSIPDWVSSESLDQL